MTTTLETAPAAIPSLPALAWDAQFRDLKARFPKAPDSVIFAIHGVQQNPSVALADLKAQADMHGIRITAASVSAANRLLTAFNTATRKTVARKTRVQPSIPRNVRRARAANMGSALNTADQIKQIVTRIQADAAGEASKLRDAVSQCVRILQTVL